MSKNQFDLRLIDNRVFTVTFIFTLIAGLNTVFNFYLSALLVHSIGTAALGAVNLMLSGVYYVLNPVLHFVVLYTYCGGPLLNRIARVFISIVFGSLLGYWVGYMSGALVATTLSEQSIWSVPPNLALMLTQYVIGQVLSSFAVLSFSDIVPKWRNTLPNQEFQTEKPEGLVFLIVAYVFFALLNILALPYFGIYLIASSTIAIQDLGTVALVSTLGLAFIGQLVLAVGLHRGRKWAWILAVISSASSVLIEISAIGIIVAYGAITSTGILSMITGLVAGCLISLVILSYLMSVSVRQYFGFVNPIEQTQRKPSTDESRESSSSML